MQRSRLKALPFQIQFVIASTMMKWNWMSSFQTFRSASFFLHPTNSSAVEIHCFVWCLFFFAVIIIKWYLHKMFINQLSNLKKNHHNPRFEWKKNVRERKRAREQNKTVTTLMLSFCCCCWCCLASKKWILLV